MEGQNCLLNYDPLLQHSMLLLNDGNQRYTFLAHQSRKQWNYSVNCGRSHATPDAHVTLHVRFWSIFDVASNLVVSTCLMSVPETVRFMHRCHAPYGQWEMAVVELMPLFRMRQVLPKHQLSTSGSPALIWPHASVHLVAWQFISIGATHSDTRSPLEYEGKNGKLSSRHNHYKLSRINLSGPQFL